MNTIFKNITHHGVIMLFLFTLSYGINIGLYFYLPKAKESLVQIKHNELEYLRYDFLNSVTKKELPKEEVKQVVQKKQEYQLLSNITLIAIIDLGDGKGVVTLEQKGSSDALILGNEESFKEYILKEVYKDYVIFEKENKQYRVTLNLDDTPKFNIEKTQEPLVVKEVKESIQKVDDVINVQRDYLNSYINDFDKIWKDIAIKENKIDGKIDGFTINHIAKGSAFEKLGLKKNDIIKSVNNIQLKSYNDAFKLYNKIDNTKSLQIMIERDNQQMEINYEIK